METDRGLNDRETFHSFIIIKPTLQKIENFSLDHRTEEKGGMVPT